MVNIIPHPKHAEIGDKRLELKAEYKCDRAEYRDLFHRVSDILDRAIGAALAPGDGGITFASDSSLEADTYTIHADAGGCSVTCGGREALGYALATLAQISEKCNGGVSVPFCDIWDKPESTWRGLSLDVARKWHPMRYLHGYVDLCFMLKVNRFQIHFTDDESYTLPSDEFPLLPTDNRHYSRNELAELCEHAKDLGVTIVPEVDMPGHSTQFTTIYPEVFGTHGITRASEETFDALKRLYAEVIAMFPDSPYIHIGGDEAILGRWNDCEESMAYMEAHGLPDIVALYSHYIARVTNDILSMGKTPVVWEGFRKEYNDMISKKVIVIGWESYYQLTPDLAKSGFPIINCSWKPMYIVSPWTHFDEKSPAYNKELRVPDDANVLGGQICAWGDYIKDYESCEWTSAQEMDIVRSRLSAMSEKTWNVAGVHTKASLLTAFERILGKLERLK